MKQFNRFLFIALCFFACFTEARTGWAGVVSGPGLHGIIIDPPEHDTASGLIGYYYQDHPGSSVRFDTLKLIRVDSVIKFAWGDNAPTATDFTSVNDFSVRWVGLIEAPVTGTYTFHTNTDDGSRLFINGKSVIDFWGSCCQEHSGTIDLVAGKKYPVKFEMHENGGGAGVSYFEWEAPGIDRQQVPTENLYAIVPETASKPGIFPVQGLYEGHVGITLATPTPGASVHYTLDGSDPTLDSPAYDSTFEITETATIKARAFRDGMFYSSIATATYTIIPPLVPTPTFTPSEGIFGDPLKIFIHTTEDSATIYYTVDGSTPDTTSPVFTDSLGVQIDSTTRVKAYAVKQGWTPSQIGSATFTILPPAAEVPQFSVKGGEYDQPQQVTITCATPGVVIHYAVNNAALNAASPVYASPLNIDKTTTLKAYAEKDGLRTSEVEIVTYIIGSDNAKVAAPQFSMPAGNYKNIVQVALFTDTKGAHIYYTTDGSEPTEASTVFYAPVPVNDSTTIKAFATLNGMQSSDVVTATYVINGVAIDTSLISSELPVPELTLSPNPATYYARISWKNLVYTLDGVYITVTDSKGTVMQRVNIKGGYTYYRLNTANYADGVYFIRVQSGKSSVVRGKLIIGR